MPFSASDIRYTNERVATLRQVSSELSQLAGEPAPSRLSPADSRSLAEFNKWLRLAVERINGLASQWTVEGDSIARSPSAISRLNQTYDAETAVLQQNIQAESRKFQSLSNVAKARHDIAMNSIKNMKA